MSLPDNFVRLSGTKKIKINLDENISKIICYLVISFKTVLLLFLNNVLKGLTIFHLAQSLVYLLL